MSGDDPALEQGEDDSKQFLVRCESCSFERSTDGREEATRLGNIHHRETGHEIVALEVPPSVEPDSETK
ncbi:hypothetical protein [Halopiger xanaduensis]|uniref:Uncharacterized protein n=1 Tax=Halopiger xanaduensis (strain DSM 18323 / JCM 14033 / SH-6) TaxID=797210 RepID=F8D9I3_HALXS|nr:hypothetical protein [Halopiger xanaduensis]AEH38069.1 hypothetical protein Halxa_3458 [Halopiger xanaduensis SH-6]